MKAKVKKRGIYLQILPYFLLRLTSFCDVKGERQSTHSTFQRDKKPISVYLEIHFMISSMGFFLSFLIMIFSSSYNRYYYEALRSVWIEELTFNNKFTSLTCGKSFLNQWLSFKQP